MTYVLVIEDEQRPQRVALAAGDHLVGSGPDCDVLLGHPTVSRRHARVEIDGNAAHLEDLGSSNGTRVDGDRLTGRIALRPGMGLRFGAVAARVEEVEARDLEPGIVVDPGTAAPIPPNRSRPLDQSTDAVGSLRTFALRKLPGLVERLASGADTATLASWVAEALASTLPVLGLQIARVTRSGERAVLFVSEPGRAMDAGFPAVVRLGELELSASFPHASQAEGYRPLLEAVLRLVAMAPPLRTPPGRSDGPATRTPPPAPLPDPPSLDPVVRRIYDEASRVARGDVSVLISGDSGTGKEVLARFLHAASRRRDSAFVALNCAALPADLLESELFGIESGVATGVASRPGKFELADGGTLFLDEIGDMAAETQAKILRVLQEGEVFRLGARQGRPARARIVAATNRDVESLLDSGRFRRDLFHRIADWRVELPPLRERPDDIPNLAAHFLEAAAARQGVAVAGISRAALDALTAYQWPGNVRQLEREMARCVLFLQPGELLRTEHLLAEIRCPEEIPSAGRLREILAATEARALRRALEETGGNASAAARRLGIGRSTFYRRLAEHGIGEPEG